MQNPHLTLHRNIARIALHNAAVGLQRQQSGVVLKQLSTYPACDREVGIVTKFRLLCDNFPSRGWTSLLN